MLEGLEETNNKQGSQSNGSPLFRARWPIYQNKYKKSTPKTTEQNKAFLLKKGSTNESDCDLLCSE